jgi:hypothetical protein
MVGSMRILVLCCSSSYQVVSLCALQIVKEVHSAVTTWTDDKHSSYLNSMEATFVRNLYGTKNSHPIDDDEEEDCADSHLMSTFDCCTSTPSEVGGLSYGCLCFPIFCIYYPLDMLDFVYP